MCVCVCTSPGSASPSHPTHLFKPFLCEPPICEPLHSKAPAFRAPYLQAWYLQPEPGWKSPVSWTMETVWIRWQRARISHLHISTALCVCSYMLRLYFNALYAIWSAYILMLYNMLVCSAYILMHYMLYAIYYMRHICCACISHLHILPQLDCNAL